MYLITAGMSYNPNSLKENCQNSKDFISYFSCIRQYLLPLEFESQTSKLLLAKTKAILCFSPLHTHPSAESKTPCCKRTGGSKPPSAQFFPPGILKRARVYPSSVLT